MNLQTTSLTKTYYTSRDLSAVYRTAAGIDFFTVLIHESGQSQSGGKFFHLPDRSGGIIAAGQILGQDPEHIFGSRIIGIKPPAADHQTAFAHCIFRQ